MVKSRYGPAALAALLLEAPQCVPYAQRVEIFRSLIVGLKQTCAESAHGSCDAVPTQSSTGPPSTSLLWLGCTTPRYTCSSAMSTRTTCSDSVDSDGYRTVLVRCKQKLRHTVRLASGCADCQLHPVHCRAQSRVLQRS